MHPSNLEDEVTFGIFVTASQGCEHAQPILQEAMDFKSDTDTLNVLDISNGDCLVGTASHFSTLPHLLFDSADEFHMRRDAVKSDRGTHTLILEDHMSIDETFLPALREFLTMYKELPALGFYAVNGTTDTYGSRILFRWIFGLASLDLWPRSPEPVCSAFLINNHFFSAFETSLGRQIRIGELESHVIPYLVPRVNGLLPKDLHVVHSQRVSVFQSAQGVYENARISAHQEKKTNFFQWLVILVQRHYFRLLKIIRVGKPSLPETIGILFLANVGLLGGIVGRFGSIKASYQRLARTHTQSRK